MIVETINRTSRNIGRPPSGPSGAPVHSHEGRTITFGGDGNDRLVGGRIDD
jgi:hypothetical protein